MNKVNGYEIVDDALRTDGRVANLPWIPDVLAGKTVFVPQRKASSFGSIGRNNAFVKAGLRLRTHEYVRDGVPGVLVWAVPR